MSYSIGAEAATHIEESAQSYRRSIWLYSGESKTFNNYATVLLRLTELRRAGGAMDGLAELIDECLAVSCPGLRCPWGCACRLCILLFC
jgi:hypothetical protein